MLFMLIRMNLRALRHDEVGLTTVETVMLVCLIAVIGGAGWRVFGTTITQKVCGASAVLTGTGACTESASAGSSSGLPVRTSLAAAGDGLLRDFSSYPDSPIQIDGSNIMQSRNTREVQRQLQSLNDSVLSALAAYPPEDLRRMSTSYLANPESLGAIPQWWPGVSAVGLHGAAGGAILGEGTFRTNPNPPMTASALATYLSKVDNNRGPVLLWSCATGAPDAHGYNYAQDLANRTGRPVVAPDKPIFGGKQGDRFVFVLGTPTADHKGVTPGGDWRTFLPNKPEPQVAAPVVNP